MFGVPVSRRAPVGVGPLRCAVPTSDNQTVGDDEPAVRRLPGRLKNIGTRQVTTPSWDHRPVRPEPEAACGPVKDRAEDRRSVRPWQAHPLDVAARRDQSGGLTVGEEGVLGDGWERARTATPRR